MLQNISISKKGCSFELSFNQKHAGNHFYHGFHKNIK